LAKREAKDPLKCAIDLEMRARSVASEDIFSTSKRREKEEYLRWQMGDKAHEENNCVSDKELALK
jgi:hypothetical protein